MEEQKKSNVGLIVLVVILLLLCLGMGAFIFINKDKLTANESTSTVSETENSETSNNAETEINSTKTNGECPLTKFNQDFTLSNEDKVEIMEALNAQGIMTVNELKLTKVSESGYYFNAAWQDEGSGEFASITKVNGKYKVLTHGSGDTVEGSNRMESTLKSICE